jgi:hypothetical protein
MHFFVVLFNFKDYWARFVSVFAYRFNDSNLNDLCVGLRNTKEDEIIYNNLSVMRGPRG